jgi:hypothetical protein
MQRLDEHREVGNSEASAERLSHEHAAHWEMAQADVQAARALRERGMELGARELAMTSAELLSSSIQGSDSVGPKCEELQRMATALEGAMDRRAQQLEASRLMHAQIGKVSFSCAETIL